MNYGLPYKGSKNSIAKKIIDFLPPSENFYDLFAGGCAITHAALESGKYKNVFVNDIEGGITQLFLDSVNGNYKDEKRWISREDFFKLKESDAYVKYCWSFGNNGKTYLYSKEIEPYKQAFHFAVFGDYSYFEKMGVEIPAINAETPKERRLELSCWISKNHEKVKEKYIKWYMDNVMHSADDYNELKKNLVSKNSDNSEKLRQYLIEALKDSGITQAEVGRRLGTQMQGHYFCKSQWEFPTQENYEKMQKFMPKLNVPYLEIYGFQELLQNLQNLQSLESLQRLQSLQRLENLESLERLQRLENLESLQNLQRYNKSYDEIDIKPNSVIYCDIPYNNTDCGSYDGFNHDKFYGWAKNQQNIFISEYAMPTTFESVFEIQKICPINGKKTSEKIFTPTHR